MTFVYAWMVIIMCFVVWACVLKERVKCESFDTVFSSWMMRKWILFLMCLEELNCAIYSRWWFLYLFNEKFSTWTSIFFATYLIRESHLLFSNCGSNAKIRECRRRETSPLEGILHASSVITLCDGRMRSFGGHHWCQTCQEGLFMYRQKRGKIFCRLCGWRLGDW